MPEKNTKSVVSARVCCTGQVEGRPLRVSQHCPRRAKKKAVVVVWSLVHPLLPSAAAAEACRLPHPPYHHLLDKNSDDDDDADGDVAADGSGGGGGHFEFLDNGTDGGFLLPLLRVVVVAVADKKYKNEDHEKHN